MSTIIRVGETFHGIRVESRGVFTNAKHGGSTYAGQCRDGYACGLGVLMWSINVSKVYAEHGPDEQYDGRYLRRNADGGIFYRLWERGRVKAFADVCADGRCQYNSVACAPDDPRLLALIAQVAPVEVRPAAPDRHPPLRSQSSDGSAGSFCPSQALAKATATEVHPRAARRR
jgi:hypothetical protein